MVMSGKVKKMPDGGADTGDARRREREERRRAQEEAEKQQEEEGLSIWELKYTFQEPVGDISIVEDWSGEGNGIAGLQWLGGVVLRSVPMCFVRHVEVAILWGWRLKEKMLALHVKVVLCTWDQVLKASRVQNAWVAPRDFKSRLHQPTRRS
ncbi:unnamed protein product, partial [Discosporangium mesarthrocarpum]